MLCEHDVFPYWFPYPMMQFLDRIYFVTKPGCKTFSESPNQSQNTIGDQSPINQNFDLNKSKQKFYHSLKEHNKISNIPNMELAIKARIS
jgi:hypothetical protein